jgi:hypothetical protein
MTIDHASREPEPSAAPPGYPPPGGQPPAVEPDAPAYPPGYDMRILTGRALELSKSPSSGKFTVENFADAVQYEFELPAPPTDDLCWAILRKLDYVTAYPGKRHFRIQTG